MSTARSMSPLRRSEKSESQRSSPAAIRNCIAVLAVVIGRSERVLKLDLLRLRQSETRR
jgi:hypothetical protein